MSTYASQLATHFVNECFVLDQQAMMNIALRRGGPVEQRQAALRGVLKLSAHPIKLTRGRCSSYLGRTQAPSELSNLLLVPRAWVTRRCFCAYRLVL